MIQVVSLVKQNIECALKIMSAIFHWRPHSNHCLYPKISVDLILPPLFSDYAIITVCYFILKTKIQFSFSTLRTYSY